MVDGGLWPWLLRTDRRTGRQSPLPSPPGSKVLELSEPSSLEGEVQRINRHFTTKAYIEISLPGGSCVDFPSSNLCVFCFETDFSYESNERFLFESMAYGVIANGMALCESVEAQRHAGAVAPRPCSDTLSQRTSRNVHVYCKKKMFPLFVSSFRFLCHREDSPVCRAVLRSFVDRLSFLATREYTLSNVKYSCLTMRPQYSARVTYVSRSGRSEFSLGTLPQRVSECFWFVFGSHKNRWELDSSTH